MHCTSTTTTTRINHSRHRIEYSTCASTLHAAGQTQFRIPTFSKFYVIRMTTAQDTTGYTHTTSMPPPRTLHIFYKPRLLQQLPRTQHTCQIHRLYDVDYHYGYGYSKYRSFCNLALSKFVNFDTVVTCSTLSLVRHADCQYEKREVYQISKISKEEYDTRCLREHTLIEMAAEALLSIQDIWLLQKKTQNVREIVNC